MTEEVDRHTDSSGVCVKEIEAENGRDGQGGGEVILPFPALPPPTLPLSSECAGGRPAWVGTRRKKQNARQALGLLEVMGSRRNRCQRLPDALSFI